MRFAGDALNTLNHDNYGQHTVDGQQRLVEPVQPNTYPQVVDTPAHLIGQQGFDAANMPERDMGEQANLFNPFSWFDGKNQSDIEKMESGSHEKIESGGIGGAIMNRNRMLNQLRNELR